jgi:hypothetical protein
VFGGALLGLFVIPYSHAFPQQDIRLPHFYFHPAAEEAAFSHFPAGKKPGVCCRVSIIPGQLVRRVFGSYADNLLPPYGIRNLAGEVPCFRYLNHLFLCLLQLFLLVLA